VFTPEKIEEWIQEARERPSSAPLIIQFIANRLADLSEWNEKLRTENIELRSGARIDEYERRIVHLEYQLELLKRQLDGELDLEAMPEVALQLIQKPLNLLVYGPQGRILRLELEPDNLDDGRLLCRWSETQPLAGEPPRALITSTSEELLLIFTSGRIITLPVGAIHLRKELESPIDWEGVPVPEEPNIGETLACIVPISKIAMADFFLQISRRGYLKKIRKALAPTIMENKYIGTGVKIPADQTLVLTMSTAGDQFILVSYEGYVQYLPEEILPYAIVEAMRLGKSDHLVAAFPDEGYDSILVMTQIGKGLHRTAESLEIATDLQRKGRMLYSTARRDSGVRVVGAGVVKENSWGLALHQDGGLTIHNISELIGRGSIPVESELIDFVVFQF